MKGTLALLGMLARSARHMAADVARQSLLKNSFIALFSASLLAGLWSIFLFGFRFLDRLGGAGMLLLDRLFSLFFFGLALLLLFSGFITAVAFLFRAKENDYLLTLPLPDADVVLYKLFGTVGLSSWAYFFVVVPFMGAYAQAERISPLLALWTLLLSLPFVFLCAGAGFLACLLLARLLPRRRGALWWAAGAVAAVAVAAALRWMPRPQRPDDAASLLSMAQMIPGLSTASDPWWPSQWVTDGILSLARGQYARGAMMLLCLVSWALMAGWLVRRAGAAFYREALQRVAFFPRRAARRGAGWGVVDRLLSFLPRDVRALCMKDLRTFLRDPVQWTQGLIFFGLLGIYFFNLRVLRYHTLEPVWRNLIAFLNLFSVAAVTCSYGARFLFPQLSLEGQAFWFIGISPVGRRRILLTKLGTATATLLVVAGSLMALSNLQLALDPPLRAVTIACACLLAVAVAGLSTGLGALFMDLRSANPAAIVSSFGGTLNLILSLAAMFVMTIPVGVFFHLHYAGHLQGGAYTRGFLLLLAHLVVTGLLLAAVPVLLALRSFARREF